MSEQYVCPKCRYHMALSPLKNVTVVHLKNGKHTYRIRKGR